jgi:hypothetical protein
MSRSRTARALFPLFTRQGAPRSGIAQNPRDHLVGRQPGQQTAWAGLILGLWHCTMTGGNATALPVRSKALTAASVRDPASAQVRGQRGRPAMAYPGGPCAFATE